MISTTEETKKIVNQTAPVNPAVWADFKKAARKQGFLLTKALDHALKMFIEQTEREG